MKYIRTKDGRIIDLEKFINKEKATPYYRSFRFGKIKKDGTLKWSAIGTDYCSIKDQIGRRCHFGGSFNSEIIKQADTIEELCDEFVGDIPVDDKQNSYIPRAIKIVDRIANFNIIDEQMFKNNIYGAIWTDKGLIYVAKMNEKGELELL